MYIHAASSSEQEPGYCIQGRRTVTISGTSLDPYARPAQSGSSVEGYLNQVGSRTELKFLPQDGFGGPSASLNTSAASVSSHIAEDYDSDIQILWPEPVQVGGPRVEEADSDVQILSSDDDEEQRGVPIILKIESLRQSQSSIKTPQKPSKRPNKDAQIPVCDQQLPPAPPLPTCDEMLVVKLKRIKTEASASWRIISATGAEVAFLEPAETVAVKVEHAATERNDKGMHAQASSGSRTRAASTKTASSFPHQLEPPASTTLRNCRIIFPAGLQLHNMVSTYSEAPRTSAPYSCRICPESRKYRHWFTRNMHEFHAHCCFVVESEDGEMHCIQEQIAEIFQCPICEIPCRSALILEKHGSCCTGSWCDLTRAFCS